VQLAFCRKRRWACSKPPRCNRPRRPKRLP
jgi:hypothetical protein